MNETTMETLARRLDRVERENRRMRLIGIVILILFGLVLSVAATQEGRAKTADEIQATRFTLVDDKEGHLRGVLRVDDEGSSVMALYDKQSEERINLKVDTSGSPSVTLIDSARKSRVWLTVAPNHETAGLRLYDRTEVPRADLFIESGGLPRLSFYDKLKRKGARARIKIQLDSEGEANLILYDKNENLGFILSPGGYKP